VTPRRNKTRGALRAHHPDEVILPRPISLR
jgi:hypothetical protein